MTTKYEPRYRKLRQEWLWANIKLHMFIALESREALKKMENQPDNFVKQCRERDLSQAMEEVADSLSELKSWRSL